MSYEHEHEGARPPGVSGQPADRRVLELDEALRGVEAGLAGIGGAAAMADPTRAVHSRMQSLGYPGHWTRGMVVQSIPYLNWYKVQCGDGYGWVSCCKADTSSQSPLGVRTTSPLPPGSLVLVFIPKGLGVGFIAGSIPPVIYKGQILCPDWIVQGGMSGMKHEEIHKFPVKSLYKMGGVLDFSQHKPMDATAFEHGWITPTGVAVTVDDFYAQFRVHEMCGLFLSWFDSWCRLAGINLRIESSVHEEEGYDDEMEARHFKGVALYPWEALGLYKEGTDFTKENDDKEVQYDKPVGKVDLPPGEEDLQPCYRWQEFGGYLGQGHTRILMKPGRDSGKRKYQDSGNPPDEGLFREHVAADGSYSAISAKRFIIGKRGKQVVPFQVKLPEDQNGDDAEKGNYKFSGKEGGGEEHKIKDIQVTGEWKHMRKAAAVYDVMAYVVNWQALHPFHYHKLDYVTKQERDLTRTSRIQENISFGELASQPFIRDAQPKKIKIDDRYGDVDYFERESFLCFHDDGTVQLAAGCGEQILLGGGDVEISAPGKVKLLPGTELIAFASQMCFRSKGSIDFSSSNGDFRAKADKNMQFLSGNGGRGGMLFHSKGAGDQQQYQQRYGEDVQSAGIVLKSEQGVCAIEGKNIYLRTGGADLGTGDIIIDANKGRNKCYIYASPFNVFTNQAVEFFFGPQDETSNVRKLYHFGEQNCIMDEVKLLVGGKIISYKDGGVIIEGGCYGTKAFATAGVMADKKGMFLGKVPGGFGASISTICAAIAGIVPLLRFSGTIKHQTTFPQKWYLPMMPGNTQTIEQMEFSFRDPPGQNGKQYGTQQLKWPETRWQTMARLGMGSGGSPWSETPVVTQGTPTYPYPGKNKWLEDSQVFLQLSSLRMFDAGQGIDQDRPGPYEDPRIGDWTNVPMASGYKLIR